MNLYHRKLLLAVIFILLYYVWLEVVGVVPTTDYFKESYSLE